MSMQFHGWIVFAARYDLESGDDIYDLRIESAKEIVGELGLEEIAGTSVDFIRHQFEFEMVNFSGVLMKTNRFDPFAQFMKEVGAKSNSAYGIAYVMNSGEVHCSESNGFLVYILRRGELVIKNDPFLSPTVPTVMDWADARMDPIKRDYFDT